MGISSSGRSGRSKRCVPRRIADPTSSSIGTTSPRRSRIWALRLAVESQISRIIQHQVRLAHSPAVDPRKGWRRRIRQARAEIDRILQKNPSLRREIPHLIEDETQRAVELALRDLEEYDEIDRLDVPSLRRASFSEEQVLGDWFAEDPRV